ncbi:MAG: ABC transporter permease subunit [Candidatus Methanomethylophilaceae archaeon]|jgi:ABC-2 type transport system permease protein
MKEGVADDLRQSYVVMKNEMTKFFRGKRMLLFLGLVVTVLLLITVLPYALGDGLSKDPKEIIQTYISFVYLLVLLAATLFASVTIVSEYEERTALILFTRPIKKSSIFLGKFSASLIIGIAFVGLYYLLVALISLIVAGGVDSEMAKSLLLAVMYVIGTFGVAILISSIMKKASTSTIITFVILLMILPIISAVIIVSLTPESIDVFTNPDVVFYDAWWMLDQASNAIYGVLSTTVNVARESLVMVAWGLASTAVAFILFKRKEF